ncbi:hypothetical protein ATE66_06495 [Sphingopyxis sp. H107]|nr:hypothetical protein ATE64_00545 [Sphingopyxis sp. H073]KTE61097.1 hypothetical protein ATE66_06495 [Sphingopyxis sp. H107]KTE66330.1 hypothetical protein ATE65_05245 [Sphingopyxis sp. H100]KTE72472.1 hypothetical protein ATE60_09780 [Sphingopyxis sp. H081]KTE82672.1 hypothetical protein ATE63_01185 [Sphingopyxis sp. H067]
MATRDVDPIAVDFDQQAVWLKRIACQGPRGRQLPGGQAYYLGFIDVRDGIVAQLVHGNLDSTRLLGIRRDGLLNQRSGIGKQESGAR